MAFMSGKRLLALILPSGVAGLAEEERVGRDPGLTDQQSSMLTY